MQVREVLGFQSGINNLSFFLLYESMLLGKWLQMFGQTVRAQLRKGQISKTILSFQI